MNTSSCELFSDELLNKIKNVSEDIGVSKFCREVGINRVTFYNLNKNGLHTKKTINKFKRYFINQDNKTILNENDLQKNDMLLDISSQLNEISVLLNNLRKTVNKEIK
tara:strand:+ start:54 stop:377 length:324 start_codon:yes stop_codon:yes gene_type:complete